MLPVKLTHDHDAIQRLNPLKIIDLRDYGMAAAAPAAEDGHPIMVFRVDDQGLLIPAD